MNEETEQISIGSARKRKRNSNNSQIWCAKTFVFYEPRRSRLWNLSFFNRLKLLPKYHDALYIHSFACRFASGVEEIVRFLHNHPISQLCMQTTIHTGWQDSNLRPKNHSIPTRPVIGQPLRPLLGFLVFILYWISRILYSMTWTSLE